MLYSQTLVYKGQGRNELGALWQVRTRTLPLRQLSAAVCREWGQRRTDTIMFCAQSERENVIISKFNDKKEPTHHRFKVTKNVWGHKLFLRQVLWGLNIWKCPKSRLNLCKKWIGKLINSKINKKKMQSSWIESHEKYLGLHVLYVRQVLSGLNIWKCPKKPL